LGAPDPREAKVPTLAEKLAQGKRHWAYQPIQRGAVPVVREKMLELPGPIDAFVQAKLDAAGIRAVGTSDKHTLLRG